MQERPITNIDRDGLSFRLAVSMSLFEIEANNSTGHRASGPFICFPVVTKTLAVTNRPDHCFSIHGPQAATDLPCTYL